MSNKSWEEYIKARMEYEEEQHRNFANGVEGWYGDKYFICDNGTMRPVESIYSDDPPVYTD
jgi:hypothetical protein